MARIATLTSGPPDGTGGTDRHLGLVARVLLEQGHQLDHYHFAQLNPPRRWTLLDRMGFRYPAHGHYLYQRALARPYRYDLFIVNSYLGAYIPRGQPVVNVFHSCDAAYAVQTKEALGWKEYLKRRWVWGYFEQRSGLRHYPVAVSRSLQRELRHYYRFDAKKIVPCCVDIQQFCPGSSHEARQELDWSEGLVVIFAGTWCYRKGADLFTRLSRELSGRARFVAVSPEGGWDLPRCETVEYLTNIPPQAMPGVFRAADLLVFPSRAESFGLVSSEALACCLATVTSTAGIGEEYRREPMLAKFVLDAPVEYALLRTRVEELLADFELRQRVGRAGREFIQSQFSLPGFEQAWRELVDERLSAYSRAI